MKLEDRIAIVTGAAGDIGQAIALGLAKEGADVVVADIDSEGASKVVDDIKAIGRRAIAIITDVTKSEETNQMAKVTLDEFGKIDILVNNTGRNARERMSLFCESTEDVWDDIIAVNLKGVFNCTRAVINHMMERRSGKIVSVASVAGVVGSAWVVDYSAAKAGVIGFSKALAKEVAQYGINVNCVSPSTIETKRLAESIRSYNWPLDQVQGWKQRTGLGRLGKTEEVAAMVVFLATDDANFITGQNYAVCGLSNLGSY
jgi:NAD(P)-dependent dehydrogenase (short-subunit alcohol dehydrogenase family)